MKKLNDFIDVTKGLRKSKSKEKVCPRCGSNRIHLSNNLGFWLTPAVYVCEKCDYIGSIVLELEKNSEPRSQNSPQSTKVRREKNGE
jgi:predicted RNA-binding Zn-ribbon protein involved in translation (DUF1610 family)